MIFREAHGPPSKQRLETFIFHLLGLDAESLNETMSKADQNCSFLWFLIDEITHGSVTAIS